MSVIEKPIEEETVEVPDVLPAVDRVTQLLIDAKAYMMERGWCSYGPRGRNGSVCTLLAMFDITNKDLRTSHPVWARFHAANKDITRGIGFWNDHVAKSVEEVYEAFDRAIAYKE